MRGSALLAVMIGMSPSLVLALDARQPVPLRGEDLATVPLVLPGWSSTGQFGLFVSDTTTSNAETARDTGVRTASETTTLTASLDATLLWTIDDEEEIEQRFQGRHGRSRASGRDWIETADLAQYDGVYRYRYVPSRAWYVGSTIITAFTGPEPEKTPFDPLQARLSAGHAWLQEGFLPITDRLEERLGVRTQKRWGTGLSEFQREVETGPEAFIRYERTANAAMSYWAQAEVFSEFDDLAHLEGLATAALVVRVAVPLTVDLRLRMVYERLPRDIPDDEPRAGYQELGLRLDTLVGFAYGW
jgi:hypothetical protein